MINIVLFSGIYFKIFNLTKLYFNKFKKKKKKSLTSPNLIKCEAFKIISTLKSSDL